MGGTCVPPVVAARTGRSGREPLAMTHEPALDEYVGERRGSV